MKYLILLLLLQSCYVRVFCVDGKMYQQTSDTELEILKVSEKFRCVKRLKRIE